jgi:hypothetical protein
MHIITVEFNSFNLPPNILPAQKSGTTVGAPLWPIVFINSGLLFENIIILI